LLQATRTVPIVFPVLGDPVAAGYVESLARPGGNATGFMTIEYSMSAKWLELLREIAPSVNRVAVLRDPTQGSGTSEFAVIQAIAPSLRVEVSVYYARHFVSGGGLISFGFDYIDQYQRAARYVDRILNGEKPGDLPVQAPVKYETVINLNTAKALGLDIPPTLLARADEVIE
jgi:putative ABC transport system substrate-binding protein